MTASDREACLRFALTEGFGPRVYQDLREQLGSASAIVAAPRGNLAKHGTLVERARNLTQKDLPRGEFVCFEDADYPPPLKEIYDPPILLWYRGRRPRPAVLRVAIVGTRKATPYGRRVAADLAWALSDAGVEVVSGLAIGIDGSAHRGALEGLAGTTAVLGSGIDRIFPAVHRQLAHRILEDGTILSEFPPGTRAYAGHFPRRNRLISGLCDAVIVVEAAETGGALITARLALDQGRELYAVPGDVGRPSSIGTNRLILETEAEPLLDVAQVLAGLSVPLEPGPRSVDAGPGAPILDVLSREPRQLDHLCEELGVGVSDALVLLLDLELRGLVRQYPGKQFGLI